MTKFVFRKAGEARTVAWPCKATLPIDGGKIEEQTILATFRLVEPSRMAEVLKPGNLMGQNGDVLQLRECLVSVEGADDLADVFADPIAVSALARGYWDMIAGRLAKN
jgi:hypothetical protein